MLRYVLNVWWDVAVTEFYETAMIRISVCLVLHISVFGFSGRGLTGSDISSASGTPLVFQLVSSKGVHQGVSQYIKKRVAWFKPPMTLTRQLLRMKEWALEMHRVFMLVNVSPSSTWKVHIWPLGAAGVKGKTLPGCRSIEVWFHGRLWARACGSGRIALSFTCVTLLPREAVGKDAIGWLHRPQRKHVRAFARHVIGAVTKFGRKSAENKY